MTDATEHTHANEGASDAARDAPLGTPSSRAWLTSAAAAVGVLLIAYLARAIAVPLVGAALLGITLNPSVRWLHRHGLPRRVTAVVFALIVSALVMVAIIALGSVLGEWVNDAPQMIHKLENRLATIRQPLDEISKATTRLRTAPPKPEHERDASNVDPGGEAPVANEPATEAAASAPAEAAKEPAPQQVAAESDRLLEIMGSVLGQSISVIVEVLICIVLTLFLLLSGDVFLAKLLSLFPNLGAKKHVLSVVREVEADISRFLGIWTLVNLGVGVVVWIAFTIIGVPEAWLWGVVAMLFNYVPYAGPWVNGGLALVMGLITFEHDTVRAVMPATVILTVNVIEGFIVTPTLQGQRLSLNTVAVLLATILGGWLWGVPGALMAVPLLVVLYVISSHVPAMKTVALFLDDSAPGMTRPRDRHPHTATSPSPPDDAAMEVGVQEATA